MAFPTAATPSETSPTNQSQPASVKVAALRSKLAAKGIELKGDPIDEFLNDAEVRADFRTFDTWLSYVEARETGKAHICGSGAQK